MRRTGFLMVMLGAMVALFSALFIFSSCSSLKPISYTMAEDETNSVSISFKQGNPSVSFVFFDDRGIPDPEKGTFWDPLLFPSDMPLEITVHAYYQQESTTASNGGLLGAIISTAITASIAADRSVDTDVVFTCPPLEAGTKYELSFRKEAGIPGINKLILTDTETKAIVYQQNFSK
jgi:hypothetical protein